jgi:hypothetical protein
VTRHPHHTRRDSTSMTPRNPVIARSACRTRSYAARRPTESPADTPSFGPYCGATARHRRVHRPRMQPYPCLVPSQSLIYPGFPRRQRRRSHREPRESDTHHQETPRNPGSKPAERGPAASPLPANNASNMSGGPGELHPRAPTERSVTVSRHSALLIEVRRTCGPTASA